MPSAEIITIGTELLLGEKTDTNTTHIARTLRRLGIDIYRTTTIGDNVSRIAAAIQEALQRADIIITTGGLGPTIDDPTREAVALAVGVQTEFRPELWQKIIARIAQYGRLQPGENQKRQAVVPQSALILENPVGTAPAFIVESKNGCVISLPGVPREMETILSASVVPYLQQRYHLQDVIKVRVLHAAGMGEGTIDERIADLEALANPTVGLAAHSGIVDIRIAAKAPSEAEADRLIAPVEAELRARLGQVIFGADEETLEAVTLQRLQEKGWQLAFLAHGLHPQDLQRLEQIAPSFGNLAACQIDATLTPAILEARLEALRAETHSQAAVGVHLHTGIGENILHAIIITPEDTVKKKRSYGGHPRNAERWAYHLALNWLRRQADTSEQ